MKKTVILPTLFFIVFALFNPVTGGENCDKVPELDGITSASKGSRIVEAEACETYVVLTWRVTDSNGEQKFMIGKSKQYDRIIPLADIQAGKNMTTKIDKLEKNTQYYVRFFRKYEGKTHHLNFEIKTQDGISPIITAVNKGINGTLHYTVTKNRINLTSPALHGDRLVITSLMGKKIYTKELYGKKHSLVIPQLSQGVYTISLYRNGSVMFTGKLKSD